MAANPVDPILTYDIGGSHITAGLCQLRPLPDVQMATAPLPDAISCEGFVGLLQELAEELIGGAEQTVGACLAFPGPFSYDTGISRVRHKLGALYGVDLRLVLAQRFGWAPQRIRFLNDANAALLGEVGVGAAEGAVRAVGIMLGTGVGFAFAQDGSINETDRMVPPDNEIWNIPFMDGIVEDVLSSRALEGDYAARTAKNRSVAAIALEAEADPDARAAFDTFGRHLGRVIREIIAPLAPEMVVFGGGISRSSGLFLPAAREQIDGLGIRLVPSVLQQKAPLLGGAIHFLGGVSRKSPSNSALPSNPALADTK